MTIKEFCCEAMKEGWLSGCVLEIDQDDLDDPKEHQLATYHMEGEYRDVKLEELYLYDDEMSQIEGQPFKYCPWCRRAL